MRIVVAADSFKGSLSSKKTGEIYKKCAEEISPDITVVTTEIADGGEGTLDAVVSSGKFYKKQVRCKGPLFADIDAYYGVNDKGQAFVEMAQAGGLTLIPYADGNAALTTTYGVGELIAEAVKGGAKEIYVSVGGSATNDGGIGALAALGYRFLSANGEVLTPNGGNLINIASIDTTHALDTKGIKFIVLTDVDNPLIGPEGATKFYGRQKGAVGALSDELEQGMTSYADVVEKTTGVRLHDMKGAGAAGGLSAGLVAFLGAELRSGIETVLSVIDFEETLTGADLVVTGEGRIDDQSAHGKAISGVCDYAKKGNIPVVAMVGCSIISDEGRDKLGLKRIFPLSDYATDVADSMKNAEKYASIIAKKILTSIYKGELL